MATTVKRVVYMFGTSEMSRPGADSRRPPTTSSDGRPVWGGLHGVQRTRSSGDGRVRF